MVCLRTDTTYCAWSRLAMWVLPRKSINVCKNAYALDWGNRTRAKEYSTPIRIYIRELLNFTIYNSNRTASAVPDSSTTHDSADCISGQFPPRSPCNRSIGHLRFRPLFVEYLILRKYLELIHETTINYTFRYLKPPKCWSDACLFGHMTLNVTERMTGSVW